MSLIFNQDFQEFIQCLNEAHVEYLIVGGYATIIHGYNRTTGDLDVWVNKTESNFNKLRFAFQQFHMPLFDMTEDRFLNDPDIDVFTFGRPPVCIDIMTQVKGLIFDEAYHKAETRILKKDLYIKLINLNDLISAKKAVNRPKDQDDIEHLTRP